VGNLVVFMSISLDGFVAAAGDGPGQGLGVGGEVLHEWLTAGRTDPASHRPPGGVNAEVFDEMLASGAVVTGRHTFDWAGEWGGDHHDGVPIFVLTRHVPEPAVQGLVHYVTDPAAAVAAAKDAAGDRDVMAHGGSAFQALLRADLVDEVVLTVVPVLLGRGRRLFDDPSAPQRRLTLLRSREGTGVVHLTYRVGPGRP
jgi:dihydrofolate reductase